MFQQRIGYCPQFDTNLELMSGEEMLYLFARLRGIPKSHIKKTVTSFIETVDLQEHAQKISSSYSGGNKRKLSIGISMIGLPPLIFLDEPTSGIDPVARRQIWDLLTAIKASGISVVLTSHSMEECEALCDCVTIMVNGQLQCMGSVTHLRAKYGTGFMIEAKLKFTHDEADNENLQKFKDKIKAAIPSSIVKSEHQGTLSYHVTDVNETWSHMFTVMEEIKESGLLENYAVSSPSLEQVFLSFAKMQKN
ncbi:ATP-binding cassette sub-family A member 3 [Nymphon striatum]|nr:ATP-binding cassette sub-family A member 3 [Nymphon striatum]